MVQRFNPAGPADFGFFKIGGQVVKTSSKL
jgi:hypothetical protein